MKRSRKNLWLVFQVHMSTYLPSNLSLWNWSVSPVAIIIISSFRKELMYWSVSTHPLSPEGTWCWSCCSSRRPRTWPTAKAASRCTWPPGEVTWTSSASSSITDPHTAESINRWGIHKYMESLLIPLFIKCMKEGEGHKKRKIYVLIWE